MLLKNVGLYRKREREKVRECVNEWRGRGRASTTMYIMKISPDIRTENKRVREVKSKPILIEKLVVFLQERKFVTDAAEHRDTIFFPSR